RLHDLAPLCDAARHDGHHRFPCPGIAAARAFPHPLRGQDAAGKSQLLTPAAYGGSLTGATAGWMLELAATPANKWSAAHVEDQAYRSLGQGSRGDRKVLH